jgi:large subunit ribosomal protein L6
LQEKSLILKLGFSHEIKYDIPNDISILVSKSKGTVLIIKGKENYKVQQVAREIRMLRAPDAYKGKGIHYKNENLILKKGKRESK